MSVLTATIAGLAEDGDVVRVAAERLDVVADPLQRQHDIQHPGDAGAGKVRTAEILQVQEPEDVQAMVDADHDDVPALREVRPVAPGT